MKTLSPALRALNARGVTTWTLCWEVIDRAGNAYRATQHDRVLTITTSDFGGVYEPFRAISASSIRSNPEMAVDNLNIESFTDGEGITQADIEGGILDGVTFTIFACDWQQPDAGQVVLRTGQVGEIIVEREGRLDIELRGLAQSLQQNIVRTYGPSCDANLGDTRCKVNLDELTQFVGITSVLVQRRTLVSNEFPFFSSEQSSEPGELEMAVGYAYGTVRFLSGENTGFVREVLNAEELESGIALAVAEPFPYDFAIGDQIAVTPGCDKTMATCKLRFDNTVNFRGFPYVPGRDTQIAPAVNTGFPDGPDLFSRIAAFAQQRRLTLGQKGGTP